MWKPVPYSDEYLKQIIEMTREYYGEENDIANEDYICYEYFNNVNGDVLMRLALDEENGVIAGQYAVIPMKMKVNRKIVNCLMSVNTLTRKEYRGQKIFTGLADSVFEDAADKGYEFVYGMPNQNSYPGFVKKLRFDNIGAVPLYLKPISPSNMVMDFKKSKILEVLAKPFNMFFDAKQPKLDKNMKLVKLDKSSLKLADDFWEKVQNEYPIIVERTSEYLKFRYLDIPRRKYECYYILENNVPVAFAVGRVMEVANMQCGMLADFIYLKGHEKAAKSLLKNMSFILKDKGADLVGVMMQSHFKEAKLIKRCGYFKCPKFMEPQPFLLILRTFNEGLKNEGINDIKNWFFTMGDYDVV